MDSSQIDPIGMHPPPSVPVTVENVNSPRVASRSAQQGVRSISQSGSTSSEPASVAATSTISKCKFVGTFAPANLDECCGIVSLSALIKQLTNVNWPRQRDRRKLPPLAALVLTK